MSLRPDSVRDTASGFSLDQYFNAEASLPPPNALSDSSRIVLANSAMSGSVVKKKKLVLVVDLSLIFFHRVLTVRVEMWWCRQKRLQILRAQKTFLLQFLRV